MAISARYSAELSVSETLESNVAAATSATIRHEGFNSAYNIRPANGDAPGAIVVADILSLTAGALTIDLTNLAGTDGTKDGTGLKVQAVLIRNHDEGNAAMTFGVGASNGYQLKGATWEETLLVGQEMLFYGNDATPDIEASAKTIDVTGTGTESFQFMVVLG